MKFATTGSDTRPIETVQVILDGDENVMVFDERETPFIAVNGNGLSVMIRPLDQKGADAIALALLHLFGESDV